MAGQAGRRALGALFAKSQDMLAFLAAQAEREHEPDLTAELDPDAL